MHICMMHLSMIHNPDTCMYDAYIYLPRSLTLQQACVYDAYTYPDTRDYDAHMYDAFIHDPRA